MVRVLAGAAVIVAAALVFLVVAGPVSHGRNIDRVGDLVPGPCTIAAAGSALTVQIDGIGATGMCERYAAAEGWLVVPNGAGGTALCQISDDGLTYTVRDTGVLMLYGSAACDGLTAAANGGSQQVIDGDVEACDPGDTPGCGSDVPADPGTLPLEDQVRQILQDVGNGV